MKKALFGVTLGISVLNICFSGSTKSVMAEEAVTESMSEMLLNENFTGEIEGNIYVPGRVYSFDNKNSYKFSEEEQFENTEFSVNTYGFFSLNGAISEEEERDGIPAYGVDGGQVSLFYTYGDTLLNAPDEDWHLISDKSKTVDSLKLKSDIKNGAIILQTSQDGKRWVDDVTLTNVFKKVPREDQSFYTTRGVQLSNGCYYRVIIVYETERTVGENKLLFVVKTDDNEHERHAEVYEFYLYDRNSEENVDTSTKSKSLGSVTRTGTNNGYKGSKDFDIKDPHYGWELGDFFVSGYTRETENKDGKPVFLKNVGDQITLWFNLRQDINKLNGDTDLSIAEDDGYDQYFQTPKTSFGRGALIIRYTDEEGVQHDPEIYANFLEANATTSADTIVQLFEEGDYEVALDYEIKSVPRKVAGIEVIPEYTDYRIYFEFAVRNGNCMVFPFDVATHEELTNRAITENGFYLDLARSRYLEINVQRSVITEGASGLTEDVRFNRPAKDGDEYTDPGLYTISVKNLYTNETTTKELFVGSDNLLDEYLAQGVSMEDLVEE